MEEKRQYEHFQESQANLYCQYHMKLIFTLPLLVLFCNAPFTDRNTLFIISRSGKQKWLSGQLLYIVLSAAAYYGFILLCTVMLSLPYAEFTANWGKLISTLAYTETAASMGYYFIEVPAFILLITIRIIRKNIQHSDHPDFSEILL